MAQFDIYDNQNKRTKEAVPYFVDIQNDIVSDIATRLVVPLVNKGVPITKLNPKVEFNRENFYLRVQEMAGISVVHLGEKVGTLKSYRQDILDAVDFLLVGF